MKPMSGVSSSVPELSWRHRACALDVGWRYLGDGRDAIHALPHQVSDRPPVLELVEVTLPEWAQDIGVGNPPALLVDASCIADGAGPAFERCDWLKAFLLHLDGWLERSVEDSSGPIHSYALRLPKRWQPAYDRAWCNRILLFLRRWAARHHGRPEEVLFGPKPSARFVLTHDVDALEKTLPIVLKATVMSAVSTVRHLAGGRIRAAGVRLRDAIRFSLTRSDYWLFDEVCDIESQRGFRSVFLFADRGAKRDAVSWLIDPSYRVNEPRIDALMRKLTSGGWEIGIHPGFKTWESTDAIAALKDKVAGVSGLDIDLCRQHWLRFSWGATWKAQEQAGITHDFTLGFNDRSGFRNGAALAFHPWDRSAGCPMAITALPTVLMDSQFYDYGFPADVKAAQARWVDEVMAVGGEVALLWHVHTMHPEYGWGDGYRALLDLLAERRAQVTGGRFG